MIRRRISQNSIKGKRFQVSDVPDLTTSRGVSKENDEMRKLAMDLSSFADEVEGKISDVAATIPAPTVATTTTTTTPADEKPKPPKLPILEVWQDGSAVVVGTRVWDFVRSDSIRFEVFNDGNQRARIQAYTLKNLNTMWGRFNGGYAVEVPNTNGQTIDIYNNATAFSQPFSVQKNRSLVHWVGDAAIYEPALSYESVSGINQRKGFIKELPSQELASWTAYSQGVSINGSSYDVTTVKARVAPQLQFFDPDETINTTEHVTRVFMKETATITPHVTIDSPVSGSGQFPYQNVDPRLFTAALSFDVKEDAYTIENLGSYGPNIGSVYKERIGHTFYMRRIRAAGSVSLSEDAEYITISGLLTSGGGTNLYDVQNNNAPGFSVYSGSTGINPKTFVFRPITVAGDLSIYQDTSFDRIVISGSDTTYTIRADNAPLGAYLSLVGDDNSLDRVQFVGVSGTSVVRQDNDTILISSPVRATSSIDNCTSGVGTGLIYHDTNVSGTNTTYYLRHLLAGSGIAITTQMHDVVIANTVTDTQYSLYAQPSGADALIRLRGTNNIDNDVKIVGSGSVDVEYIDNSTIRVSAALPISVSGTNSDANCITSSLPYSWYRGNDDTLALNTRTLKFGKFATNYDLVTQPCGDGYIFSVQVVGSNDTTNGIGVYNRKTGPSPSNLAFRGIRAGTGINVSLLDGNPNPTDSDIVIACTVSGSQTNLNNCGDGAQLVSNLTVSGTNRNYDIRTLKGENSWIDVTTSGCNAIISVPNKWQYYNIQEACSGTGESIIGNRLGAGTLLDPYCWSHKKLKAGANISLSSDSCDITITASGGNTYDINNYGTDSTGTDAERLIGVYDPTVVTVSGTRIFKMRRLQSFTYNHGVGIHAVRSENPVGNETIELKTRDANWNTTHDKGYFLWDTTTNAPAQSITTNIPAFPSDTYAQVYFDRPNIYEPTETITAYAPTNDRIIKSNAGGYTFYFQPNKPADQDRIEINNNLVILNNHMIFNVAVRLFVVSTIPIGNVSQGAMYYPQISLFKNGAFYRTLDVDLRIGEFAQLRQALLSTSVISGETVPEAGTRSWLHGSSLIQLNQGDTFDVRFKHVTGAQRSITIYEASIDITRTGLTEATQQNNSAEVKYNNPILL